MDRPEPRSVHDLPVDACKYGYIRVYGKRPLDTVGPEDTFDVLRYVGAEMTEDKKMDKRRQRES